MLSTINNYIKIISLLQRVILRCKFIYEKSADVSTTQHASAVSDDSTGGGGGNLKINPQKPQWL